MSDIKHDIPPNKPEWMFDVYWSLSTPLAVKLPSYKHYPLDLYLSDFIIQFRMRDYMIVTLPQIPDEKKELAPIHWVMGDFKDVVMPA